MEQQIITSEIVKLSPREGDVFLLVMKAIDPEIIFMSEIKESSDHLADVLSEQLEFDIKVINITDDLSELNAEQLSALISQLQSALLSIDKDAINLDMYNWSYTVIYLIYTLFCSK